MILKTLSMTHSFVQWFIMTGYTIGKCLQTQKETEVFVEPSLEIRQK